MNMNEKMKKLYEYARNVKPGKLPKPLTTLYQLNEFLWTFKELARNKSATFLTNETKALYEKFDFTVKPHGIGYIVEV